MKKYRVPSILGLMVYRFGRFQLDIGGGTLHGTSGHISLPEKPFRLLCALLEAEGRVPGKEAAMGAVWPGQIVSDASLATALKAVRDAIGDTGEAQRLIETVKGRGIRMAVPVISVPSGQAQSPLDGTQAPVPSAPPTLAILRFVAQLGTLSQAILADLISALSKSWELRLIARGSAFCFLSGAPPRAICGNVVVLTMSCPGISKEHRWIGGLWSSLPMLGLILSSGPRSSI